MNNRSAGPFVPTNKLEAPGLLLVTGSLLAVTLIISRLAASEGAPLLWFLAVVMVGAGLILLIVSALTGQANLGAKCWNRRLVYSLGAGAFQAVTMSMAYLSVAHVGVGYISLAFAFPLLVTYLLALTIGMEQYALRRALGVVVALAGGLMIAMSKFSGLSETGDAVGWVLVASAIPFVIAGGNLYRTRYWPTGAPPLLLAALMLLLAGLLVVPVAVMSEGTAGLSTVLREQFILGLTALNVIVFALKFVAYFKLQQVAGPVYLSQIGAVGAAVGTPVAVLFMGELLPHGFLVAIFLILVGALLFQMKEGRRRPGIATIVVGPSC